MAYVLSSVSGNLISAASAGFAPTNSADVSAIASAYQVVSSTATQLYAGTAYVTSVNDAPLSASRAGNAANASMANSAYYDGTGRLISALPDSATVSAIASSYAESAASSKQDTLTFGYNTADQISSIDGSALGGMDEAAVSAIASAYAESAASGKQDALTFGYDADNKISSIDGSAIAGGEQIVTSLQYTTSQSGAIIGYTTGDRAGNGEKVFSARYYPNKGWYNYQSSTALASVGVTSLDSYITGNTEYPFEIFMIPYGAADYGNIKYISSVGSYMSNYGQFNNTSDFRIATGMATLSGYSAILDFDVTSLPFNTQHGSPMWGTGGGMVLEDSVNSQPVFAVVFGSGSDREGRCARIVDGPQALGFGAITTVSAVSGINELGIAGGGAGGIDSATCSAIASAYAESAVSSKADSSALSSYALSADVSGTVDLVSSQSANWGGSALALSAGPGVKLEKVGDTLVASQDRILLWSGDMTTGGTRLVNLSEPLTNFESLGFWHSFEGAGISNPQWAVLSAGFAQTTGTSRVIGTIGPALSLKPWENNDIYQAFGNYVSPSSATNNDQIYLRGAKVLLNGGVQDFGALYHCYAIYGINRTAEA